MDKLSTFLKFSNSIAFVSLCLLMSDSKAVKITESPEEVFIESENRYPKKIFAANDFLQEVGEKLGSIKTKPLVEIDLSNDESLNSRDIKRILAYFKKMDIKIRALNVSGTGIDSDLLPTFNQLLKEPNFKCLDISDTQIAEVITDTDNPKVIFVPVRLMQMHDTKVKIKKIFGEDTFKRHLDYYSLAATLSVEKWED